MELLSARNLSLEYKDGRRKREIFSDVSLDISENDFTFLLGPSGSGKSSLLYILSLLREPTSGEIILNGNPISKKSNRTLIRYNNFGFVFQHHFLIPHLTALENVCVAVKGKNISNDAKKMLERLGLGDLINQKIYLLSGGERQRVAIARAVIKKPKILFADEPTASLDAQTASELMELFSEIRNDTAIVCATHDIAIIPKNSKKLYIANRSISNYSD